MAFSEEILREAWERAGSACECMRRTHRHFYTPCNKMLRWSKRGEAAEGGWEARALDGGVRDSAANCEVLCMDCYGSIY
jgi:hypothetical protein